MKVEYLFSRNNKLGSKAIAWVSRFEDIDLDKVPSHIAVLLDDELVVESTFLTGIRLIPYYHWLKKNEELYRIPCSATYRHSKTTLSKATRLWGKEYDWLGIIYFAWAFVKLILFNRPLPEHNEWQRPNKYFCTEYAGMLTNQDFSMSSPAKICDAWIKEY